MEKTQPQPTHKKAIKKAWLFTIILHLFIAGVLITYWYFNQSKKPDPVATNLQTNTSNSHNTEENRLPPLKTGVASVVTPTNIASTTNITTNPETNIKTAAETNKNKGNTEQERPLSKYINTQAPNIAPAPATPKIVTEPTPKQNNNKQKLTARDIPRNEMPPSTNTTKTKTEQQEINRLNQEVEQDNDKISKLIEHVKNQNQRKINENVAKNTNSLETPTTNKATAPTDNSAEKTPSVEEKTQPANDTTQTP